MARADHGPLSTGGPLLLPRTDFIWFSAAVICCGAVLKSLTCPTVLLKV